MTVAARFSLRVTLIRTPLTLAKADRREVIR